VLSPTSFQDGLHPTADIVLFSDLHSSSCDHLERHRLGQQDRRAKLTNVVETLIGTFGWLTKRIGTLNKLRVKCTLPLTSARPVDLVVSELAVIGFPNGRATLLERGPGVTVERVIAGTQGQLFLPDEIPEMRL
jgi:hypothetical protein